MSAITARLPLLAAILVIVAMVSAVSWQGYRFWVDEQQHKANQANAASENLGSLVSQQAEVDLASLDLFGSSDGQLQSQEIDTENLPETNLRIFLRGVLAADGKFPASALIEDSDSKTEAYVVGDELPGGALLRSVHPHRVILDRSGKLENLYFPETDDQSGLSVAINEINETTADQDTQTYIEPPAPGSTRTASSSDQRREEIRQRLEQLRERLRKNSN